MQCLDDIALLLCHEDSDSAQRGGAETEGVMIVDRKRTDRGTDRNRN